ncbi:MAG: 4-hydroxy-tetrahydrodipicolinate reductase [bacterium]
MAVIRVIVNGAKGRMGQETVRAVSGAEDMELVGECDLRDDVVAVARSMNADAIIDFTGPAVAMENARKILAAGCAGVIGTTGFTPENIEELRSSAAQREKGFLVAPNFAIGAILMMHFASEAARFMHEAEIVELHHPKKLDAPSGTALKTAESIARAWKGIGLKETAPVGAGDPARGKLVDGICVHSVRLTGLLAHQEVVFGGEGQTLSIRHDTQSRASFMPGVLLGTREMMKRGGFSYGLESLLFA